MRSVAVLVACVTMACGGIVEGPSEGSAGSGDTVAQAGAAGSAGAAGEAGEAGSVGSAEEPCPPLPREYAEGAVLVSTPGEPTALRVEGPAILEAASLGGTCYRLREAANIDGTIRSVLWPEGATD